MSRAEPLVSVLMTVRDGATYLPAAVTSIQEQTVTDFEFIAIDDGSTDETWEILQQAAATDDRMAVLQSAPRGIVAARNHLLARANGQYIAPMDADDVALPNRLDVLSAHLAAHPDVAVVGGLMRFIDGAGAPIGDDRPSDPDALDVTELLDSGNPFANSNVMMRVDAVRAVGGYRATCPLAEEYDLYLRLAEAYRIHVIGRPVLLYRIHPGQTSVRHLQEETMCSLAAFESARARRAGRTDPLDTRPASGELLAELGVTPATVRLTAAEAALGWARRLELGGYLNDAEPLIDQALRLLSGPGLAAQRAVAYGQLAGIRRRRHHRVAGWSASLAGGIARARGRMESPAGRSPRSSGA
jgi:Glycosyl transferase family 2